MTIRNPWTGEVGPNLSKEFLTNGWFRYYCQLASWYSFHFYGWDNHKQGHYSLMAKLNCISYQLNCLKRNLFWTQPFSLGQILFHFVSFVNKIFCSVQISQLPSATIVNFATRWQHGIRELTRLISWYKRLVVNIENNIFKSLFHSIVLISTF